MKKILTFAIFTISGGILAACSIQTPIAYNDTIINAISSGDQAMETFATYATETDLAFLEKIQIKLNETKQIQQNNINILESMKPYKEDDSLRQAAITYIINYNTILENEYQEIVELWKNIYERSEEEFTEEEIKKIQNQEEDYFQKMIEKIAKQQEKIEQVQKEFAKKHNFEIEEITEEGE